MNAINSSSGDAPLIRHAHLYGCAGGCDLPVHECGSLDERALAAASETPGTEAGPVTAAGRRSERERRLVWAGAGFILGFIAGGVVVMEMVLDAAGSLLR